MKRLRRLIIPDICGMFATFLVIGILLLVAVVFCGREQGAETLLLALLIYVLLALLATIGLVTYIVVLLNVYRKSKKELQAITGFSWERLEREADRMPPIKDVLLCSDAICFSGGYSMIKSIPIKEIVWVHQEQQQTNIYLQIYTVKREHFTIPILIKRKFGTKDAAGRFVMRLIARKNKGALIGYQKEYEDYFEKDFSRLLALTQGKEIVDSGLLEQDYIQNDYYTADFR